MAWDAVIVGGGTAGCVLAARLSENADRSVLLLEAGHDYPGGVDELPAEIRRERVAMPAMDFLWFYPGILNEHLTREVAVVRGRVIGGSGAVNGAIFQRGLAEDYDAWGSSLWTYEAVLPYFRRSERDLDFDGPLHGNEGPVPVRRFPKEQWPPSQRAFHEAALAYGYPEKLDHMDPDGFGIGPAPRNGEADVRMSAALTHLQPARGRPNLEVRGDARVVRVRFDGRRTTGVDVLNGDGGTSFVEAREVILAGGGISTPHLLMTSGVGPADALARHGIEVVADLPGVGKNLRDHPAVPLVVDATTCLDEDPRHHLLLVYTAEGSPKRNDMNLMLSTFLMGDENGVEQTYFNFLANLVAAESCGEMSLTSPDPLEPPRIVLGYLESELDRRRLREGVRINARLASHPAFERIGLKRLAPTDDVLASDDALDEWMVDNIFTFFHTCGTCRMGDAGDPDAVVDERGLVHGVEGLRVADLSIAPDVPRAATNATAFMIGERIADLCRQP